MSAKGNRNGRVGGNAEAGAMLMLEQRGALVVVKAPTSTGVDIIATYPDGTIEYVEVKGGYSHAGGFASPARVKEALAMAVFHERSVVVYVTRMPEPGSLAGQMTEFALAKGYFADVRLIPETLIGAAAA